MSEVRSSCTPSLGTSAPSVVVRPPKRRLASTSELDFFTPAATSFKPRPYTPRLPVVDPDIKPVTIPRSSRSLDTHALPPAGMDPQPTDPDVVFIHPPFTDIPNVHLYPDGLSYPLMAENPEWFLDANDFIAQHNANQNAIPYPPHLEPPRGWCPAKKKYLKDRGSDGWPEGEEPRLRCTFCRRTYAGVNAKSMWRRHVFEKHKIAMSNRRDTNERPRGRGSNKENRTSKLQDEGHDKLVNMDITPQTEPGNVSHKSQFRSLLPTAAEETRSRRSRAKAGNDVPVSLAPRIPQDEFSAPAEINSPSRQHLLPQSHNPPISPPLTPQSPMSSDLADASFETSGSLLSTSSPQIPIVPASPYDPLQTPSFRHSPLRLPSDQPWRFPSPSHPLHSYSRELSLSMLIRDLNSPITKGSTPVGGILSAIQISPNLSPRLFGPARAKRSVFDLDTPESMSKLPKPSPHTLFLRGQAPTPTNNCLQAEENLYHIEESPLGRGSRTAHKKSMSGLSEDWLAEISLASSASSLETAKLLTNNDPFVTMYSPWVSVDGSRGENTQDVSSPVSSPERESPVLRSSVLPPGVGLGIGLLEPFMLPEDEQQPIGGDTDFDSILTYPPLAEDEGDEDEVACVLAISNKDNSEESIDAPPLKKRRMTADNHD